MGNTLKTFVAVSLVLVLSGCTFIFQRGRRSDVQKIEELSAQLEELSRSRSMLEDRLSQEISDKQVKLQMMGKGLVITVVGDLVFDSGKDKIRSEAYPLLDKVADILKYNMAQYNVGIEGYTDDRPIKFSGWKSNWELSTARSLSVLHYLIEEKGIDPARMSAIGYSEFRPVASNDSAEGRKLNRRVEIVIQPKVTKVKGSGESAPEDIIPPQGNLK